MAGKRVDPETGAAVTYRELVAKYKRQYRRQDIDAYWLSCAKLRWKPKAHGNSREVRSFGNSHWPQPLCLDLCLSVLTWLLQTCPPFHFCLLLSAFLLCFHALFFAHILENLAISIHLFAPLRVCLPVPTYLSIHPPALLLLWRISPDSGRISATASLSVHVSISFCVDLSVCIH